MNKPLEKTLSIAETIKHYSPDVLMLSEVGGKESLVNFNKHFLNEEYEVLLLEGNSDRGIDLGYLVKKNLGLKPEVESHKKRPIWFLYPRELKEYKKITRKNSLKFSRDVLELKLKKDDETWMIFLLVHLKSKLDMDKKDFEGRARRQAELKELVNFLSGVKTKSS
jgi:hypothetical protein